MVSALNKLPDGTIELTITIPWAKIKEAYRKTLNLLASEITIDGFRKGKAPLKKVEDKIGKTHIYEELLKDLIPEVYAQAVREHKLNPIISPRIEVLSLKENSDWQIKAKTCELPRFSLGNYREAVKTALAPAKIWVPEKKAKDQAGVLTEDQKIDLVVKTLMETVSLDLPAMLVEDEVNRMLSRLIDQTARLGITIEQYLSSVGKDSERLRQEYTKQAEETLKLELILSAIANEEKVEVSDQEIEKMIEAVPEESTRRALSSPEQKPYLAQLLRKRKVIDNLTNL